MNPVSDELLELLNGFPAGTMGFAEEEALLKALNLLCREHGYGRVPQLCAWLEELWRHPDRAEAFRTMRAGRVAQWEYAFDSAILPRPGESRADFLRRVEKQNREG